MILGHRRDSLLALCALRGSGQVGSGLDGCVREGAVRTRDLTSVLRARGWPGGCSEPLNLIRQQAQCRCPGGGARTETCTSDDSRISLVLIPSFSNIKTSLNPHSNTQQSRVPSNSPRALYGVQYARSTSPRPSPLQVTLLRLYRLHGHFHIADTRLTHRRGHARRGGGSVAQLIKPYMVAQRSITSTSGAPPLASTPQQPHVAFSLTRICAR